MNEDVIFRIFEYLHHLNSKTYLDDINIINNINRYKRKENHVNLRIEIRCIEILENKKFTGVITPPVYYFIFKKFLSKHKYATNH